MSKSQAGWLINKIDDIIEKMGMTPINFKLKGVTILGIFFTYNRDLHIQNNIHRVFCNFTATLSIWKMRKLTLYGKIQILKSLALSKLYYVCSKTEWPSFYEEKIQSAIKDFIWHGRKPKIKHQTLIGDYESGGLKLTDFSLVVKSVRVSQAINLLYNSKVSDEPILQFFLNNIGGLSYLHKNFNIECLPPFLPKFYKDILKEWSIFQNEIKSDENSDVINECIWNNKHIKIQNKSIFYKTFADCNINTISDLCNANGILDWETVESKGIKSSEFLRWAGIIHAIPQGWKKHLKKNIRRTDDDGLCMREVCNIEGKNIDIRQMKMKQIYALKVGLSFVPPTCQVKLYNRMQIENIEWKIVYSRIYSTTIDSYLRFFQYKILNNILYLNRDLYRFKILDQASCSFCSIQLETIDHLFVECIESKNLYFQVRNWLGTFNVCLPEMSKINVILGVDEVTTNFILLLFKYCLYKGRESKIAPSLNVFKNLLSHYEKIEFLVAKSKKVLHLHNKKWKNVNKALK